MRSRIKARVLHITPHLGGGVGRVLLAYLAGVKSREDFRHETVCLDYANTRAKAAAREHGLVLSDNLSLDHEALLHMTSKADIVLIHWWNHPLLYDFLVREALPPSRVIIWSHISGLHAPSVFTDAILGYPDLFVFTTPVSLEAPEVARLQERRRKNLRVIWSTGGIEHVAAVRPKPHEGFNVGYIGTVDYCKMHPDFLRMSAGVNVPGVRFIVCGGPDEKRIREESLRYGGQKKFVFTGPVDNISDYLREFDVFGYPLAPYHYGTCEQSLCESMAAGVPPVVLANRAESRIVEDGVTGVVARDGQSYARAVENLSRRPQWRKELARNARREAKRRFSLDTMINGWQDVFEEALRFQKSRRRWPGGRRGKGVSPAEVFLESLGGHGGDFSDSLNARNGKDGQDAIRRIKRLAGCSGSWCANTRGTAHHYRSFFPEDAYLELWSRLCKPDS